MMTAMHRAVLRGLALALAVACGGEAAAPAACAPPPAEVRFAGDEATLTARIAEDAASRARGLMGVTSLPPDEGMAFLFEEPTDGSFWMKDTLIPLSIAFIDEDGRIISIQEMTPCEADPCRTYAPGGTYTMAVEANAGWFDERGVEVGDRADLRRRYCL
jgi:hypothetical protein